MLPLQSALAPLASIALLLSMGFASSGLATAQGDTCGTAVPIGLGSHAVDLNGLTPSGFTGGLCFGSIAGPRDSFYQWTATAPGTYRFILEPGFQDYTYLDVHRGVGCAATCVVRGTQTIAPIANTVLEFPAVAAGETFLLQVHEGLGLAGSNTGLLTVESYVSQCAGNIPMRQPGNIFE